MDPADLAAIAAVAPAVALGEIVLLGGPWNASFNGAYLSVVCEPGWAPPHYALPIPTYWKHGIFKTDGPDYDITLPLPRRASVLGGAWGNWMLDFPAPNVSFTLNPGGPTPLLTAIAELCTFTVLGSDGYIAAVSTSDCLTATAHEGSRFWIPAGVRLSPAAPLLGLMETDGCTGQQLLLVAPASNTGEGCNGHGHCDVAPPVLLGVLGDNIPAHERVNVGVVCVCDPAASGPTCTVLTACAADAALAAADCTPWTPTVQLAPDPRACSGHGVCSLTDTYGHSVSPAVGLLPPRFAIGGSGKPASTTLSLSCICSALWYGDECGAEDPTDLGGAISYPYTAAPAYSAWCVAGWLAEPPMWAYFGCFSFGKSGRASGAVSFAADPPSDWVQPDAWSEFAGWLTGTRFIGIAVRVGWAGNVERVSLLYGDDTPLLVRNCTQLPGGPVGMTSCVDTYVASPDPRNPIDLDTAKREGRYSVTRTARAYFDAPYLMMTYPPGHPYTWHDIDGRGNYYIEERNETVFYGVLRVAQLRAWGGDTGTPIAPDFRGELAGGVVCSQCVVTAAPPWGYMRITIDTKGDGFTTLTSRSGYINYWQWDDSPAIHIECDSCGDGRNQTKPVPDKTEWYGKWRNRGPLSPYTPKGTTSPPATVMFPRDAVVYGCSHVELAPYVTPPAWRPDGCSVDGGVCGFSGVALGGAPRVAQGTPLVLKLTCGPDATAVASNAFDGTCATALSYCEPVRVSTTSATTTGGSLGGYADVMLLNVAGGRSGRTVSIPRAALTLGSCTGGSGRCRLSLLGPCNGNVLAPILAADVAAGGGVPNVWMCPLRGGDGVAATCNAHVKSPAACVALLTGAGYHVDACAPGVSPSQARVEAPSGRRCTWCRTAPTPHFRLRVTVCHHAAGPSASPPTVTALPSNSSLMSPIRSMTRTRWTRSLRILRRGAPKTVR